MQPEKVFILASYPFSLINFRMEFLKELINKNYEVHVGAPFEKKDLHVVEKLNSYNIKTHIVNIDRYNINFLKEFLLIFSLIFTLIKVKPKTLISYTVKPVIYGTLCASVLGIKNKFNIITGLGFFFIGKKNFKQKIIRSLILILYKIVIKFNTKTFFQNKDDLKLFKKLKLLSDETSVCIINGSGVNLEHFKKTNLPKKNITFLLIARLLKSKGIYEFVNAAKLIKNKYKNVNFILVGGFEKTTDSIPSDDLKKWTDTNLIEWHDHVLDVRPFIINSHIYVLPSYREGTPRTVLEAMAIGRPIITTNVAGCRHLINKNGFLVKPKSSKALKVVMERFINEHHIIPIMAEASYKIAKKKYDVIKINKVLLNEMNL